MLFWGLRWAAFVLLRESEACLEPRRAEDLLDRGANRPPYRAWWEVPYRRRLGKPPWSERPEAGRRGPRTRRRRSCLRPAANSQPPRVRRRFLLPLPLRLLGEDSTAR